MKHYYTASEYKKLLESMVILVDTREQKDEDIVKWFDDNGIKHKSRALKTGDYSFMIPKNIELGVTFDTYFNDNFIVERKNSVDELAGNFSKTDKDSGRIMREFARMEHMDNCHLIIENDSIADVLDGNYRSALNSDSFLRTLLTLQRRTGLKIWFVHTEYMGKMIYELCKSELDGSIMK